MHEEGANLRVTYRDRYWSFPRDECALLPIANTTAELLADYIAGRIRQEMTARGWKLPRILRVEVEESFGQSAQVEWRRDDDPESGGLVSDAAVIEPLELPSADPAVVDGRADQDRRGAGITERDDLSIRGDAAADGEPNRRMVVANPSHQVLVPRPRPVPTRRDRGAASWRTPHSIAALSQLEWIVGRPGCRPRRSRGDSVEQVEAEDDPLRLPPLPRSRPARAGRATVSRPATIVDAGGIELEQRSRRRGIATSRHRPRDECPAAMSSR